MEMNYIYVWLFNFRIFDITEDFTKQVILSIIYFFVLGKKSLQFLSLPKLQPIQSEKNAIPELLYFIISITLAHFNNRMIRIHTKKKNQKNRFHTFSASHYEPSESLHEAYKEDLQHLANKSVTGSDLSLETHWQQTQFGFITLISPIIIGCSNHWNADARMLF